MTTERRKLSLGNVAERERAPAAAGANTKAWDVSPARAAQLKDRARDMRRNPTPAQVRLWDALKDKQLGFTFNREVIMGSAIVDFAAKTRWLVVEVGGTEGPEATLATLSDRKLADVGVRVLRFADGQVLGALDQVLKAIKTELEKPFERPKIKA
jgi:leucyl-tRNA synthetase